MNNTTNSAGDCTSSKKEDVQTAGSPSRSMPLHYITLQAGVSEEDLETMLTGITEGSVADVTLRLTEIENLNLKGAVVTVQLISKEQVPNMRTFGVSALCKWKEWPEVVRQIKAGIPKGEVLSIEANPKEIGLKSPFSAIISNVRRLCKMEARDYVVFKRGNMIYVQPN